MSDNDGLSEYAYRLGMDPIDWAIGLAENEISILEAVRTARKSEPSAFPGYFLELTPEAAGRRIIGRLLDAGWTPPPRRSS